MGKRQEPRGWGMKWLNNSDSKCSNLLNNNSQIQEFQPTRNKKSKGTHSLVHKSTPLKSHDKEKLYEQAGVGRHITDKWNIKWPQVSHKKQCKPKDKRKISVKCEKKKKKKQPRILYPMKISFIWSEAKWRPLQTAKSERPHCKQSYTSRNVQSSPGERKTTMDGNSDKKDKDCQKGKNVGKHKRIFFLFYFLENISGLFKAITTTLTRCTTQAEAECVTLTAQKMGGVELHCCKIATLYRKYYKTVWRQWVIS